MEIINTPRRYFKLLACALLVTSIGCGSGQFPVSPAKGKVVSKGQPVTSGTVTFTPLGASESLESGKPASGALAPDGSFTLSTFDRFDGAIVGKHKVLYMGGEDEESGEEKPDNPDPDSQKSQPVKKQQKSVFVQKADITVEVTANGPNDFTIEIDP